jgi:hypothetical protein
VLREQQDQLNHCRLHAAENSSSSRFTHAILLQVKCRLNVGFRKIKPSYDDAFTSCLLLLFCCEPRKMLVRSIRCTVAELRFSSAFASRAIWRAFLVRLLHVRQRVADELLVGPVNVVNTKRIQPFGLTLGDAAFLGNRATGRCCCCCRQSRGSGSFLNAFLEYFIIRMALRSFAHPTPGVATIPSESNFARKAARKTVSTVGRGM